MKESVAIFGYLNDPKLVCLLYDKVVPIFDDIKPRGIASIVLNDVVTESHFESYISQLNNIPESYKIKGLEYSSSEILKASEVERQEKYDSASNVLDFFSKQVCSQLDPKLFNRSIQLFDESEMMNNNNTKSNAIEIQIANFPIPLTKNASWEQIIDSKKDLEFRKLIKPFSNFLLEDCKGKSIDEIKDLISKKLENYRNMLSKHGYAFQKLGTKELLNSKSLICLSILALLSPAFQIPDYAFIPTIVGSVIDIAQLGFKCLVVEKQFQNSLTYHSDVALIHKLSTF